jgi:Zn-dependent peptidase ImmA (M78 family)
MYINRDLSNSSSVNRRRFTIAHEIGHVVLHQAIFTRNASQTSFLPENQPPVTCMRSRIDRPSADWIEWQAYYFASCLLMPARSVLEHARHFTGTSLSLPIVADSEALSLLVESVANYFCVSEAATEVRLNQLGIGMENVQSELLCSHASPSSPDAA